MALALENITILSSRTLIHVHSGSLVLALRFFVYVSFSFTVVTTNSFITTKWT